MNATSHHGVRISRWLAGVLAAVVGLAGAVPAAAQSAAESPTFTRDIAPILQRSCQTKMH